MRWNEIINSPVAQIALPVMAGVAAAATPGAARGVNTLMSAAQMQSQANERRRRAEAQTRFKDLLAGSQPLNEGQKPVMDFATSLADLGEYGSAGRLAADLYDQPEKAGTEVVSVGGRRVLINRDSGETIKDLGLAEAPKPEEPPFEPRRFTEMIEGAPEGFKMTQKIPGGLTLSYDAPKRDEEETPGVDFAKMGKSARENISFIAKQFAPQSLAEAVTLGEDAVDALMKQPNTRAQVEAELMKPGNETQLEIWRNAWRELGIASQPMGVKGEIAPMDYEDTGAEERIQAGIPMDKAPMAVPSHYKTYKGASGQTIYVDPVTGKQYKVAQ
jgi:hypothetical protein